MLKGHNKLNRVFCTEESSEVILQNTCLSTSLSPDLPPPACQCLREDGDEMHDCNACVTRPRCWASSRDTAGICSSQLMCLDSSAAVNTSSANHQCLSPPRALPCLRDCLWSCVHQDWNTSDKQWNSLLNDWWHDGKTCHSYFKRTENERKQVEDLNSEWNSLHWIYNVRAVCSCVGYFLVTQDRWLIFNSWIGGAMCRY